MKRPDDVRRALERKQVCDGVLASLPVAALLLLLGAVGLAFS